MHAEVANTSLKRTRLQLKYRYRQADLDENTSEGDLPGGAAATLNRKVTQDATSHDLVFRGRHRFSRAAQLKIRAGWQSLEVDEASAGDDWLWSMGDRERERLSWEAAVQTRPGADLKLDLGARGWDQTFKRAPGDTTETETSWQANTLFAGLNWNAHARLLVHGTVSWGTEKVDLKGTGDPTGSMGPVAYDGTTFRFIPGVSLRVLRALWLDGMYEGVRFEDTANESANLDALAADHDRMLVRARWEARENLAVAATYRRNEFDENRWDDYIQDIWQLSVSGRF